MNEQETIFQVVRFCLSDPFVNEVIVVDDQSSDKTAETAKRAGARVLTSKKRGKGISMKEGIEASSNQLLVFLDGDIFPYPANTIRDLANPLESNEADFVKASFSRDAGRVTELVARPLLKIFYPELSQYQQPLGGMIAGKKHFLSKVDFFEDYGVDVGILIDMFLMHAKIREVNIGFIANKSKPWQQLGQMSGEVARAIIKKATVRNQNLVNIEELGIVNTIGSKLDQAITEQMSSLRKMFVFDLDNTLIKGRFIDRCANKYQFISKLEELRKAESDPAVLTKRIAGLLKGIPLGELLRVASEIPFVEDAVDVIAQLRQQGNVVGIVCDTYHFVAEYAKNKLGADFVLANHLDFFEGKATGEVTIPSWFYYHLGSKCSHAFCKTNAMIYIAHKYDIPLENCISIRHSDAENCMTKNAGMGIAFCSMDEQLNATADRTIHRSSFSELVSPKRTASKKAGMLTDA